jgi:hypothetical protein
MKLQFKHRLGLFAFIAVAALITVQAPAAILQYNSTIAGSTRGDGPFTIGNLIQVQATDQLVTALGVQDAASSGGVAGTDGFANGGNIQVGIWTADGSTLLASTNVNTADPLGTGNYRYHTLTTPITLTANTQYLIGARVGAGIEFFVDAGSSGPFTADTGFTLLGSRFLSSSFGAPTSAGGLNNGRWGAANALTTPAPEPASVGLFASIGFAGLLRRRARRIR